MDINTVSFIQVFFSLLLLSIFTWILKSKARNKNKEGKDVIQAGILDFIHFIYLIMYSEPETVAGYKESRFIKAYKKYLSPFSMYSSKESMILKLFGIPVGFLSIDYKTVYQINKSDACSDRAPTSSLELYHGGRPMGMLMNNNEEGKIVRMFVMRKFGQLGWRNRAKMTTILAYQLSELIDRIEVLRKKENDKIQVVGLFSAAIFNVNANFATGKTFSATDPDFIYANETFNTFVKTPISSWAFLHFFSKVWGIRELFGYSRISNLRNSTRKILEDYIEERVSVTRQIHNHYPENIIDFFLQEIERQKDNDELKAVFTKDQLVTVLQDLTLAGGETITKYLELLLMYMCIHPDVQSKVQEEIDSVLGAGGALPSYYDCKSSMNYTMATFWEVHRLSNQIPFMPRMTTRDVDILGHHLKKGTVIMNVYLQFRLDETYWKKPFVFYPENFLDDNGVIIQEKVDHMLLFSNGTRVCPGEQVANVVIFTFGVGILQKYLIRKCDDSEVLGGMAPPCPSNGPAPFHVRLLDR